MIYPIWRLSEYHSDNLGLAFTDGDLLLGRTPLIERRDGRFVVRERSEIARLVKYSFSNGVAIDRLLPGLTIVASALNANNQAGARIAALHLQIPNLPSLAARDAMIAEDALIKYARDGGGASDWNPDLHPRTGTPPNSGWFATRAVIEKSRAKTNRVAANQGCASPQTKMAQCARTPRHRLTISKHCSQAIRSMSQQISPIGPIGPTSGPTSGRRSRIGSRSPSPNMTSKAVRWREHRNRITTQLGINTIHSWIGRDTQKYVPGLYWWTLLPASLAQQHGIPLSVVVGAALEHIELEGHQHLLRFYEKPEDWQSAHVMTKLYRSLPGVFDVEKLRPKLQGATTFLEINAIPHAWS
jgi:hypothetical protein